MFKDRADAGNLLANRFKNIKADIVLGIPRGGVVVAAKLAKYLRLPLDIVVTRKIGAPGHEELALGAVDPDGKVVWDRELLDQFDLPADRLKLKINDEMEEVKRREKMYRQGKESLSIEDKTVILVDDGMATGSTAFAAVKYLKRHRAKIILAMPVASREALEKIKNEVKKCIVLETPEHFQAVGQFYEQFMSVPDEEVIQLLRD
ncbi:phosphoribosyltransferase [Patescibacteria group bacterium]|nr:phosphoribosyltransferase [Patescibacteria group bacterium]